MEECTIGEGSAKSVYKGALLIRGKTVEVLKMRSGSFEEEAKIEKDLDEARTAPPTRAIFGAVQRIS
jgi:hypothetical protein